MKTPIYPMLFAAVLVISSFAFAGRPSDPGENNINYSNCRNQKRAVVVGSSVTLGFFGNSPSMLYLRQLGFGRCILKKSYPIGDSDKYLKWLKESVSEFKPELIVALDYLIHDVTFTKENEDMPERIRKTTETIDYLQSLDIPVMVGSVFTPRARPDQIELARTINRQLCQASDAKPNQFYVLPTVEIYRELYSNTFTVPVPVDDRIDHIPVPTDNVMHDFYHPGPRGAHMMTNRLMHYMNALSRSTRAFPFVGNLFTERQLMRKDKRNDFARALFNAVEEDDKYSLDLVNAETIPQDMGAEACTVMPKL